MSSSGRRREGCFHNRRPRKKPAHPAKPKFPLTDEHIRAMCPEGDGIYTDEDSIRSERKSRTDSASSLGSVVMEELNSCASGFGSGNEVYPLSHVFQVPAPDRQTNPATTPHNVCAPHLRSCTKRITRRQFTGMGEARFKSVSPSNAAFSHPLVHSRPQVVVQPKKERDFYSDASDPQAWYAIIRTMNPGDSDLFVPEYLLSYLPNVKELFHPGRDNYFNHCVDHTVFLKILRIIDNDYNKSPHDNHSDVLLYKMYEYAVKLECSFIINFVTSELKNRGHYTTEELLDLYKFASRWEIEKLLEECKTRLGKLRTAEALDVAMRLGLQDVKMAILRAMPIKALNDYFTTKLGFTEVDNEIVAKKYTRRPRPQFSRTRKFAENPQVIWPAIRT